MRWDPLQGRYGILGPAVLGMLLLGAALGMDSFSRERLASQSEMIFALAAALGTGLLFLKRSFFSSALAAVFSVTLFAATLIITEIAMVEPSVDFPDLVFYEPLKSQALHALLAFVCLFVAFLLWRAPSGWALGKASAEEMAFARTIWAILLVAALALAVLNLRGELITKAAYHSTEWLAKRQGTYGGIDALWTFLGISSLTAVLRVYGSRSANFRFVLITLLVAILYFRLLRGERSTAFGFLIFLAILYYTLSKSPWRGWVILALIPVAFLFLLAWASVRGEAADRGLAQALAEGSSSAMKSIREGSMSNLDRFPKVTWDMLETAFLYDEGIRRGGETYWNLIPQATPGFVADLVGYERPLTEPWVLANYFEHGGGIFMVAEAYWNFGLSGVIGLALLLGWVCVLMEHLYRRLPATFAYGYYGVIVISAENVLVGVQSFVRGLEIAFFVTGAGWILYQIILRRSPLLRPTTTSRDE